MLVIESPNQQLENGLVLVDTPGVGSLNTNHTDITYAFISNADVILFVSDVDKPLSQPELDFIKMIREHNQNLVYVLTKTDLVDENDYKAIVENNRQKLAKISQCSPGEITIIPVSSKNKPQKIASLIEKEIDALISKVGKELSQTAQLIYKDLEYSTGLNLSPLEVTSLESSLANISTNDINLKDNNWWGKASTASRSGFMTGLSVATIGGAIGFVAGLPFGGVGSVPGTTIDAGIGTVLGKVAGFFMGTKNTWEELDKKDRIENQRIIAKKINPIIEDSKRQSWKILNDAITKLERFMRDEFLGQIQRQKKTYQESLNSIKKKSRTFSTGCCPRFSRITETLGISQRYLSARGTNNQRNRKMENKSIP